ncbi:MAG: cytochrome c oxidase assembly protein [Acidimicrobiales bacterium]
MAFPAWHAHPDVWVLVGGLALAYAGAHRVASVRFERQRLGFFLAGVAVLLLASDWPIHDLAEHYLYSFHMVQHLLFTLVASPLLLLGLPAWLWRQVLGIRDPGDPPTRRLRVVRWIARPVPGLIQFNLVLVLSHWPAVVNLTVRQHPLHFVAHAVLLVSALLMWLPVVSTVPEVPRARPVTQMLYLFLQTVVPTVPASFLTFGAKPLYHVYETFPRLWGVTALSDQQVAGLIMKIGSGFYLWTVIAVIFFRWYANEERSEGEGRADPARSSDGDDDDDDDDDDDVLLWTDVERELQELGDAPGPG